ncbi:MAG: hypothetical protein ACRDNS_25930, partial [Trebonia sp.]
MAAHSATQGCGRQDGLRHAVQLKQFGAEALLERARLLVGQVLGEQHRPQPVVGIARVRPPGQDHPDRRGEQAAQG